MTAIILSKPLRKFLVIGPIYNKLDKLSKIDNLLSQYDYIIFNSGLFPSEDIRQAKESIQQFTEWSRGKKVIYINGRSDLLLLNKTEDKNITRWIYNNCNVVIASFDSRNVVITDGGIPNDIKGMYELTDNLEVSFVSFFDDKPWHNSYNGGLGYVIANNPLTNKPPEYYNYSMQMGNLYEPNAAVYAQEVDEIGLKNCILL